MRINVKNINDYEINDVINFKNRINMEKLKRINKMIDENEIRKSIISEIILSELLDQMNIDYDSLNIKYSKNGKPFINNELFYSIAHSNNYIAVAISNKNIGIDIEEIDNFRIDNIDVFTNIEEQDFINKSNNRLNNAIKVFTLKEAYIKFKDLSIFDIKNINVVKNNKLEIDECNIKAIVKKNYVISICEQK